jgi:ribosomal protein S18 acetylase RimI-like enzyme
MKIRKIKKEEINLLWNFEKENREYDKKILGEKFWPFYPSKINENEKESWLEEVKKSFEDENANILVVEIDRKIIGYSLAYAYFLEHLKSKKAGYIEEFFLTEKFRGKGISTKLMNESIKWFKEKKVEFVSLRVFSKNKNVAGIYEKFGFEQFSIDMKKKI